MDFLINLVPWILILGLFFVLPLYFGIRLVKAIIRYLDRH